MMVVTTSEGGLALRPAFRRLLMATTSCPRALGCSASRLLSCLVTKSMRLVTQ
jgi:hypothetical protein